MSDVELLLPREDRRRLSRIHVARYYAMTDDEDPEAPLRKLETPVCQECGERWGMHGCATVRALVYVSQLEGEAGALRRRNDELEDLATERWHVERIPIHPDEPTVCELRMRVDRQAILLGGVGLAMATLAKMGAEWGKWFRDVGDRERIQRDHAVALTMDSERYRHLTQDNLDVPFVKRAGAPWP